MIITNIKEFKELLNEMALNDEQRSKIERFIDSNNSVQLEKELQNKIKEVQELIKNINYTDIKININKNNIYYIILPNQIEEKILFISQLCEKIDILNKNEYYKIKYYSHAGYDHILYFTVKSTLMNKLDISSSLPTYIRGLHLGKKIYKKIIEEMGYISSHFNKISKHRKPKLASSKVWLSLSKDKDLYFFVNGNDFLIFSKDNMLYDMLNILYLFYDKIYGTYELDNDFLKEHLNEEEFIRRVIYKK